MVNALIVENVMKELHSCSFRFIKVGSYDGSATLNQRLRMDQSTLLYTKGQSQVSQFEFVAALYTRYQVFKFRVLFLQVPVSQCSAPCPPGSRKATRMGQPSCCFDCLPCADGEISNQTGKLYVEYTSIGLQTINGICVACFIQVPLNAQNAPSTTGQTRKKSNVSRVWKNFCLTRTLWASSWSLSHCWVLS